MDPRGHAAVVTGAASGLGAQTAVQLAEAGAKVALLDLNVDAARDIAARIGGIAVALRRGGRGVGRGGAGRGAREARGCPHPGQLCRHRAGQAHRRPRRARCRWPTSSA